MRTVGRLFRFRATPGLIVILASAAKFVLDVGDLGDIWRVLFPPNGTPSWGDYALMAATVGGIFWIIHVARDSVSPMDELTMGEVRTALKETKELRWWGNAPRLFTDDQINAVIEGRPVVDRCYAHLQGQAIYGISEARRMLRSRRVRKVLRRYYREVMERPEDALWDPDGYVHWGSMVWRASFLERPEVLRYVKRRMEVWKARGAL